jgi:hypothetical protein
MDGPDPRIIAANDAGGSCMTRLDPDQLVDTRNGLISREVFVNKDLFQQELETIFARAWLFVGHESLIANPGDYFVSRMGAESVILCRDKAGAIHVLLNTCRHRGMKVCLYDEQGYRIWKFAN